MDSSSEGPASLGRALRHSPRLDTLGLYDCSMDLLSALDGGPTPPLRLLDIRESPCGIPNTNWLASLEQLWCSWSQVRACAVS